MPFYEILTLAGLWNSDLISHKTLSDTCHSKEIGEIPLCGGENTKVSLKRWKKISFGKPGWSKRCRWGEAKTKLLIVVFRTSFFTPPQHRQPLCSVNCTVFILPCLLPKCRSIILSACVSSHMGVGLIHCPTGTSTQPDLGNFHVTSVSCV